MPEKVHHGRAVKRIREILRVKQDALAFDLGMSQQNISILETKETLDADTLDRIAAVLKIPVEAITKFDEEVAKNTYFNTFNDNSSAAGAAFGNDNQSNQQLTFNPIDKIVELYERLLKAEKEKSELAEKLLHQAQQATKTENGGN
ncbi:helix-turn-helix transcriptional regulator [Danxiaibacter flavus]|uniref:Helix-turn-helix transcriptional regulator n=1 Tax=Danxiaibacter flavus TaxID=3049108 RepID=A0ABV3ZB64_9BACT|nr:helix-turn-helix transcriptional regulator [Chitinophagaceae bacterium DXS]